jgi:hypothetical protein
MVKVGFFVAVIITVIVFFEKLLVIGMIVVGSVIFPEASQALRHYCFGDGKKLIVESDYIKNSPVVQKHLKTMKVGQKKEVSFKQREDWRLSYALNPFTIEKRKDKVIITQWMQFARTNKVKTQFGPFKISDNIVHTFKCKPYLFYHEFTY